jgi:hypothetical protein
MTSRTRAPSCHPSVSLSRHRKATTKTNFRQFRAKRMTRQPSRSSCHPSAVLAGRPGRAGRKPRIRALPDDQHRSPLVEMLTGPDSPPGQEPNGRPARHDHDSRTRSPALPHARRGAPPAARSRTTAAVSVWASGGSLVQTRRRTSPGFLYTGVAPRTNRVRQVASRGFSSAGRALAWHARGQGFESPKLHCFPNLCSN